MLFYIVISLCFGQLLAANGCGQHADLYGVCITAECEPTCANRSLCAIAENLTCSCSPGYLRSSSASDANATCVAVNSLVCREERNFTRISAQQNCETNEQFVPCSCQATCSQPTACGYCGCKTDFVRVRSGGECIRSNSVRCQRILNRSKRHARTVREISARHALFNITS